MKYSLTANVTNVFGSSLVLPDESLSALTDGNVSTSAITVSGGSAITILCDLRNRFNIDSIKYYHSGGGTVDMYISDSIDTWYTVTPVSESWGTSLDLLGSSYNPCWLKVVHSIDTGEVDIREIEIYNEDYNILFGPAGEFDSYGMDTSGSIIDVVDIYNQTTLTRDINVFIEDNKESEADDLIMVGLTSGTLISKRETGVALPRDFQWDNGCHDGTKALGQYLVVSGTLVSGTYYSPVIDLSSHNNYRFFWNSVSVGERSVNYGSGNSEDCFGVRRYNIPPSGSWANGSMAEDYDQYWSLSVGSLDFVPTPNDTILELRPWDYLQFAVTLTGTSSVYLAGIESPLVVEDVLPKSSKEVYISSVSGTTSGKTAHILCWYTE